MAVTMGLETTSADPRPTPRRRNPLGRLSAGHVLVGLAAVLAFIANIVVLRAQDETAAVWVAATDLEAGRVLSGEDLRVEQLAATPDVLAGLVAAETPIDGQVLARPVPAGTLIGATDVRPEAAPAGLRAMSIPVPVEHAAGGTIRVGDLVDVVDVDQAGVPRFVVTKAPVIGVSTAGTGALTGGGGHHLVVGLDSDGVLAVAAAIADDHVEVVLSTGAADG